jgi:hypothetical protein
MGFAAIIEWLNPKLAVAPTGDAAPDNARSRHVAITVLWRLNLQMVVANFATRRSGWFTPGGTQRISVHLPVMARLSIEVR